MAKDKIQFDMKSIERGLKTLADERVMPPANFRRNIIKRIAAETGQISLIARLGRWLSTPSLVPATAGIAALALFAFLSPFTAGNRVANTSAQSARATVPASVVSARQSMAPAVIADVSNQGDAGEVKSRSSSSGQIAAVSIKNQPAVSSAPVVADSKSITIERGSLSMPSRQPHSLKPLQSGRIPADGVLASAPVAVADSRVQLAGISTRVVTPEPTPMARPVSGFSEVRRNVFKPGQGEFVAIMVNLGQAEHVEITVYDLNGRKVANLLDETRPGGVHEIRWSGHNERGELAATGRYLVVVKTISQVERHKVAVIR